MAVPFIQLRVGLLRNAVRFTNKTDFRRIWGYILLAVLAAGLILLSLTAVTSTTFTEAAFDSAVSSLLVLSAILVPVFTARSMVTAGQFRLFDKLPGTVSRQLIVSGILGWISFLLIAWLAGNAVIRSRDPITAVFAAVGAVLVFFTVKLVANIAAELSELFFSTPSRRNIRTVLGWLLLIAAVPLALLLLVSGLVAAFTAGGAEGALGAIQATFTEIGRSLEWSPLGAALSAAGTYATAGLMFALAKIVIGIATVGILAWLWFAVVRFSFTHMGKPGDPPMVKAGLGWFDRFPATPSGVIAARSAIYWRRDARYRVSIAIVPVVAAIAVLAMWVAGAPLTIVWVMPLAVAAFLLGWSIHNDTANDATAIWVHVASETKGLPDRVGRVTPILIFGIPLIIVGSTISVALMGDWRPLPAVLGISASLLLVTAGVSSYASAVWPYPVSRPGESLFNQPQFTGYGASRTQALTILVSLVLSLPAMIFGFIGIGQENLLLQLISLALGVVGGAFVLFLGITRGAHVYDEEGPELLALSQVFD